ncbi:unnamed protein product [Mytilus coruscus]|uniref:Reverse transcriptase domain-containing protein n=1 Tax=Mytilus coruscus TaxID=42192 RepID=A0A6J8DDA0_MYTCO|nr:unnamed protein product [Mytilus coruscus]
MHNACNEAIPNYNKSIRTKALGNPFGIKNISEASKITKEKHALWKNGGSPKDKNNPLKSQLTTAKRYRWNLSRTLQNAETELLPLILHILNTVTEQLDIAQMLKGGIMTPVLKENKDRLNPANYRGITVTKIFTKILQSVLKSRIDIKIHQIQNQLQRGFTEAIPMIFAAFLASEAIIQSSEDDQEVILLTLDAEKAFDKLEHEILFNKVYHYGIDGDMWILLRNIYREMSIRIKWDDLVSDKISVNQGIQQGAKLSTSLYKCYNNAILDSVTESGLGCHMGTIGIATPTCADDILVLANSECELQGIMDIVYHHTQRDLVKNQPTEIGSCML